MHECEDADAFHDVENLWPACSLCDDEKNHPPGDGGTEGKPQNGKTYLQWRYSYPSERAIPPHWILMLNLWK